MLWFKLSYGLFSLGLGQFHLFKDITNCLYSIDNMLQFCTTAHCIPNGYSSCQLELGSAVM